MRKEPPLGLQGSYAYVRRESDRKEAMKQDGEKAEAMVVRNRSSHNRSSPSGSTSRPSTVNSSSHRPNAGSTHARLEIDRSKLVCTHCGLGGHSKARCFELSGYPEGWDKTRDPCYNKQRATIADTKDEPDLVANQASALVTTTGNEGKVLQISDSVKNTTWIIDSGATAHMTFDSKLVHTVNPSTQSYVTIADGSAAPIIGEGPVALTDTLNLDIVLVVPSLDYNLLSVTQLTVALNCVVVFWPHYCVFKDIQTRRTIGYGIRKGKLYYMDLTLDSTSCMTQASSVDTSHGELKARADIWLWHHRLGHASFGYLQKLFPSLFIKCDVSSFKCDVCELAHSHRVSFPPSLHKSSVPFMIVHSDVWGPSKIATLGGARWFVTFIDDCTRMTWVVLLKNKSDVCSAFQKFHRMVLTQYHKQIQVLRSDNGKEYVNVVLQSFLTAHGIIH